MKFEKEILGDYKDSISYIKGLLFKHFIAVSRFIDCDDVFNEGMIRMQLENEYSTKKLKYHFSQYLKEVNGDQLVLLSYDDSRSESYVKPKNKIDELDKQCCKCLKVLPLLKFRNRSKKCHSCYFKSYSENISDYYIKERIKVDGYYKGEKIEITENIIEKYRERLISKRSRRNYTEKEKKAYWNKTACDNLTDGYVRYLFKKCTKGYLGYSIAPSDDQLIRMRERIYQIRSNKSLSNKPISNWFPELSK